MTTKLPTSDDVLERHQFYAAMDAKQDAIDDSLHRQNDSIHRIHVRMDDASDKITKVHEAINTTETRNKTLGFAVGAFWMVIASALGWAWDKSTSKVESYVTKIESLEKEVTEIKRDKARVDSEIASIAALRRQITTMQQEIDANQIRKGR